MAALKAWCHWLSQLHSLALKDANFEPQSKDLTSRIMVAVSPVIKGQFGCGILKMAGPKMQDFCPRINICSNEIVLKQSCDELWFVKKCRNHTFNVNFLCQKSTEFFQKKNHLRISI